MTQLWRMHWLMGPGDVADFCVQCPHFSNDYSHTSYYRLSSAEPSKGCGIVAIGWRVEDCPKTKDEYRQRAWRQYGQTRGLSADLNAFLDYMAIGDLVWVRNWRSEYYLGKITGDWQYVDAAVFRQHEIAGVRTCEWIRIARMDEVPGAVRSAFGRGPTIQRVSEPSSVEHSRLLFAERNPKVESLPPDINLRGADVLHLISASDLVDVVACYLQVTERCVILPSTRTRDMTVVGCFLAKVDGSGRIGMHVESSSEPLDEYQFAAFDGVVYVFAASGRYFPGLQEPNTNCRRIERSDLIDFIFQNPNILPGTVARWVDRLNRANDRLQGTLPS